MLGIGMPGTGASATGAAVVVAGVEGTMSAAKVP